MGSKILVGWCWAVLSFATSASAGTVTPESRARVVETLAARDPDLAHRLLNGRLLPWHRTATTVPLPPGFENPLAAALPNTGAGPLALELGASRVKLTPVNARTTALLRTGTYAVYADQFEATDGFVVNGDNFIEALWLLKNDSAPRRFVWKIEAPAWVKTVRVDTDGGASLLNQRGDPVLHVAAPTALDAEGHHVPCHLEVDGLQLAVVLADGDLAFPVLVDPVLELPGWNEMNLLKPRPQHAMATLGNKVVLFGGGMDWTYFGDTWEWDGETWTRRQPLISPSQRCGHAMATLGDKVVLFGGANGNGDVLSDTWEWDGAAWTQRNLLNGPAPRFWHAMATLKSRVVLFGGYDGSTMFSDTWEWDGATWTERNLATKPPARYGHAMATLNNKLVLFSGANLPFNGSTGANHQDTWEWDGTAWAERHPAHSPPARSFHAMAGLAGQIVLFSGNHGLADTWEWTGDDWNLLATSTNPVQRRAHAMATLGNEVVLFGGQTLNSANSTDYALSDTWTWDGAVWTERIASSTSRPTYEHAMATRGDKVVLFGGYGPFYVGDTWEWDGAAWAQLSAPSPPARTGHAMASLSTKVVLFGGSPLRSDTWEWDGTAWTQLAPLTSPSARYSHAMATLGDRVLLFGGTNGLDLFSDTWEWDGAAWTQRSTTKQPSARHSHAMATLGSKIVLFGGQNSSGYLGDTWEWDGNVWTELAPPQSPSPRFGHAMATLGNGVLLFGSFWDDTWLWNGTTWTLRTSATHPPTAGTHSMATLGNKVVLYDGHTTDVWHWIDPIPDGLGCAADQQCASNACVDGVCCASACGGNTTDDCQVCSVAAGATADGMCTLLPAMTECRANACVRDIAISRTVCSGQAPECPDEVRTPCGVGQCSAGQCLDAQGATGGGSGATDGGPGTTPTTRGGCGCTSASPLLMFALLTMLTRRRRRAR